MRREVRSLKTEVGRRYDKYLYAHGLWTSSVEHVRSARRPKKQRRALMSLKELEAKLQSREAVKRVAVFVDEPEAMVEIKYERGDAQASWPQFIDKVQDALGLAGVATIRRATDDREVFTILSLEDGGRYAVEPLKADALFRAIIGAETVRLPALGSDVKSRMARASAHLQKCIDETPGWTMNAAAQALATERINAYVSEKAVEPKARTRDEVLARQAREADRERAEVTAVAAAHYLEERRQRREARFAICRDARRECAQYFRTLDEIENEDARATDAPPLSELQALFRRAVRWMANAALEPETARVVVAQGACERIFRYLDKDASSLQYALAFHRNLAALDDFCFVALNSGGAALALSVLHTHCKRLADRAGEEYSHEVVNPKKATLHHPRLSALFVAKRVAQNMSDNVVEPDLHWWAASVALALLRSRAREVALSILIDDYALLPCLRFTLFRWSKFRDVVVMSVWILDELARVLPRSRLSEFVRLLQMAQTRHEDVDDLKFQIEAILSVLQASDNERKLGADVGALEHPPLDHDDNKYRHLALEQPMPEEDLLLNIILKP